MEERRPFYAVQCGADDYDCGYGSFDPDEALSMANVMHEIHPEDEIRIVTCEDGNDFALEVEVIFKGK